MFDKLKHSYYLYLVIWFKYFTFKKFFNLLYNLYECKRKKILVKSKPFIVNIDVSNVCVLNCPLCPTGRRENTQTKGTIDFEGFKKVFDKIKDYVFDVKLYNWGEPFLCLDIFKIVQYCHENNVGVRLHSNLNYYTDEILENIVKFKIDYLHLSIDGYTQENYEFYRQNGKISKVFQGLEAIQTLKKANRSQYPIIHWGYLINNKNKDEVNMAKEYAQKIGVEVFEAFNMSLFTTLGDQYKKNDFDKFLSQVTNEDECNTRTDKGHCPFLWNELSVNPNGSFYPCCIMYNDSDIFGFMNDSTDLNRILNSDIFIESRKLFIENDYKPKIFTPCSRCTWYKKA